MGARGSPAVWSSNCSMVTTSFPLVPNSGRTSVTFCSGARVPSPNASHTAPATRPFVQEKMTYRVSTFESPKHWSTTISPSRARASWQDGSRPSSTSRRARSSRASTLASSSFTISDDDAADDLAGLHGPEGLVDLVQADAPGDHRPEVEAP